MAGAAKGRAQQVVRSSLPYQILLYCNAWFVAAWTILEILFFVYKAELLPYAAGVLTMEIILLFLLVFIEAIRIFLGMKGNLQERVVPVVLSLLTSIPSLLGFLYYLLWQTYVLRVEVVTCAIQLAFMALQTILSIIAIITFARASPY